MHVLYACGHANVCPSSRHLQNGVGLNIISHAGCGQVILTPTVLSACGKYDGKENGKH